MFTIRDTNDNFKKQENIPANIIGEFVIDNRRYLILLLPKAPNNDFKGEENKEVIQKIIHFEILGKHCVIIEAESDLAPKKIDKRIGSWSCDE